MAVVVNKEDANYRYPTQITWGAGYFGDGFRYIHAEGDEDAVSQLPVGAGLGANNLQKLINGKWNFMSPTPIYFDTGSYVFRY